MPSSVPESYDELLAKMLPVLDVTYRKNGKPVHQRALDAANFIVRHVIVSIDGESTDDHLNKPWFAGIYLPILIWFERRYGRKAAQTQQAKCHAVVEHIDEFYLCAVPLTVSRQTKDGIREFVFPKEVLPDEDPLSWIESSPDLATMKNKRIVAFRTSACRVASQVRAIQNDLFTESDVSSQATPVLATVIRHLDKAAFDICSTDVTSHSLAIWELQMACEKTIKGYLLQIGLIPPEIHNLRELHDIANMGLAWPEIRSILVQFPTDGRVIKWRHGELPPPKPREVSRIYSVALKICGAYARKTPRKYTFNNFAIQFRKAPWL